LCGNDAKEPMCNIQTMPIFRDVARAMVEKMDLGESTSPAVFHTTPLQQCPFAYILQFSARDSITS
jgi:hypothetical protein